MSDINQRLKALEQVAKANAPDEGYKDIYPLMPLEFTNLIYKQGEPEQALVEIWHEVIDDYEQEHLEDLQGYLKAGVLPPWRRLVDLSTRQKNLKTFEKHKEFDKKLGLKTDEQTHHVIKGLKAEINELQDQEQLLTKRALKLYERRKSEGKI